MIERKTAIITGAASGIGLETTRKFSQDKKYNPIFAVDKDPLINELFKLQENLNVIPLQLDLKDENQIAEMLKKAAESGRINVIVNAAGVINAGRQSTYYDSDGKPKIELEDMDRINLFAPIIVMAKAAQIMKKNGGGTIINISSSKHYFPDAYRLKYMQGKHSVSKITKGVAKEWRKNDMVRLVDVQPGNTKTNIDRGVWASGNKQSEIDTVQKFNDWWRKKIGNDPKNVAEVIYKIAEGKIKGTTIMVGFDAKLGHFLQMYLPIPILRWNMIFYVISSSTYKIIESTKKLEDKFKRFS